MFDPEKPTPIEDQTLETLVDLVEGAKSDVTAILLGALEELPAEERVRTLLGIVDKTSPLSRLEIYGETLLEPWVTQDIQGMIREEWRHPKIVRALVENARQTQKINLAWIPPETIVSISLFPNPLKDRLPEVLGGETYKHERGRFAARAIMGVGMFAATDDITLFHSRTSSGGMVRIPPNSVFTLRSLDEYHTPTTELRFGGSLLAMYGDSEHLDSRHKGWASCFVGAIALDGQPAFFTPGKN